MTPAENETNIPANVAPSVPKKQKSLWLWGIPLCLAVIALGVTIWLIVSSLSDSRTQQTIAIENQIRGNAFDSPGSAAESKLGYGLWTGEFRYGQPHGSGTLKYTQQRLVSQFDPQHIVARPGDYIIGEFDTGQLLRGKLFRTDGTTVEIIIVKE